MRTILLSFIFFLLESCGGWLGDSIEKLPGTYVYVYEGNSAAFIYGGIKTQKSIPCNVVKYEFNQEYIIAVQKAVKTCPYSGIKKQIEGRLYFWIIDIKQDTIYSFSNKIEYLKKRKKLKIPNSLTLE